MKPITFFFLCLLALATVTLWPRAGATPFSAGQANDTINLTLLSTTNWAWTATGSTVSLWGHGEWRA